MTLKNIILDFGGVIYRVRYMKSSEALKELSTNQKLFDDMDVKAILDLPNDFERGKESPAEFRERLRRELYLIGNDKDINYAWNAMLIGTHPDAAEFLESLKETYSLALLSNTNEIHHNRFHREAEDLLELFNHVYFSHHINMRKPDKAIFNYALENSGFKADNTLFIDDTEENILAARELGIHVIHHERNASLSELLHTIKNYPHLNEES